MLKVNITSEALFIDDARIGFPAAIEKLREVLGTPSRSGTYELTESYYATWDELGIFTFYTEKDSIWNLEFYTKRSITREELPKTSFKGKLYLNNEPIRPGTIGKTGSSGGSTQSDDGASRIVIRPIKEAGMLSGYKVGRNPDFQVEEVVFHYTREVNRYSWIFVLLLLLGSILTAQQLFFAGQTSFWFLIPGIALTLLCLWELIMILRAPKSTGQPAIRFSQKGIESNTIKVAASVGLIEWTDIDDALFEKNYLFIRVKDPQKYASRISNIFIRSYFKLSKGHVGISFANTDVTREKMDQLNDMIGNL